MKKIWERIAAFKYSGRLFIRGAGSIFNIFGSCKKERRLNNTAADILSVKNDWYAVGNDIKKVIADGR